MASNYKKTAKDEYLIAAAVLYQSMEPEANWQISTGRRHADCFYWMKQHDITYNKETARQGFLTNTNRFVDRYEAKDIAVAANQLIVPLEETYAQLYSEDVW